MEGSAQAELNAMMTYQGNGAPWPFHKWTETIDQRIAPKTANTNSNSLNALKHNMEKQMPTSTTYYAKHLKTPADQPNALKKSNYLIDIDGTICDDIPNEEPERMATAKLYPDALDTLNKWYDEGHVITFFTSRTEDHREVTESGWKKAASNGTIY